MTGARDAQRRGAESPGAERRHGGVRAGRGRLPGGGARRASRRHPGGGVRRADRHRLRRSAAATTIAGDRRRRCGGRWHIGRQRHCGRGDGHVGPARARLARPAGVARHEHIGDLAGLAGHVGALTRRLVRPFEGAEDVQADLLRVLHPPPDDHLFTERDHQRIGAGGPGWRADRADVELLDQRLVRVRLTDGDRLVIGQATGVIRGDHFEPERAVVVGDEAVAPFRILGGLDRRAIEFHRDLLRVAHLPVDRDLLPDNPGPAA